MDGFAFALPILRDSQSRLCSPEMAHFFAQNILVPRDLFSEN
jgi:hypothetical protein